MENTKVLHALDDFAKTKPKDIPKELDDYIRFVANSGDHIYQWSLVKCLFRQKLLNVISEFYESCPMMNVPVSPNVDAFNYELIKSRLLQRYDTFNGAPFTIQRIAELLTAPRKQYNRVDKFMKAIEKNIWVVSTREPGRIEENNLLNGALSPNVMKSSQERLKRDPELFDDDEEEEEVEENHETPDLLEKPQDELPTSNDSPVADPVISDEIKSETEEIMAEPESEIEADQDTEADAEAQPEKDVSPLIFAELTETGTETEKESTETQDSSEIITEKEPDKHQEEESLNDSETRTDLKRKFEGDDEDEELPKKKLETEDQAPISDSKEEEESDIQEEERKPEIEVSESTEKEPEKPVEITEVNETEPSDVEIVNEEVVEDASELKRVQVTEVEEQSSELAPAPIEAESRIVDITEVEDVLEKEMDSCEVVENEDKVEMVVEEPDQAMEVDEASVQSPMEQCTTVEPMEATEV